MTVVPKRAVYFCAGFLLLFSVVVVALWYFGGNVFSVLLQRSRAYTPPQFLTWLSLASNLSLGVAFCLMPFSLFRIVRGRSDVPFSWIVLCIAGFLFLCGLSFLSGLLTLWFTGAMVIWSLVLTRLGAAFLAVATLFILRAVAPRILEIPTHEQWLAVNNELLRAEADADAQTRMLAEVSHELRTPLAPLLATLTDLEQQTLGDTGMRDSIQVLRRNIQKQAALVNDLLGRLDLPASPTNFIPITRKYPHPQRLLLVEDHEDTLQTFARMLRRRGFHVVECRAVAEAVAKSQSGDLLISDIALPDGDGRDLMRQLSARGIPGIAISGFGSAKDREEYKRAGFAESLVKPVDIDEVISAIGRVTDVAPVV
jgi:CheY-like chemotaxis protein